MTNDNKPSEKYIQFIAQVSFWRPDGGTIPILARTESEAREILPKMLSHVKDLQVHSVINPADIEGLDDAPELPPDDAGTNGNGMMVN